MLNTTPVGTSYSDDNELPSYCRIESDRPMVDRSMRLNMDDIKIENFAKEHVDKEFPGFSSLQPYESNKILAAVKIQLGLDSEADPVEVVKCIQSRAIVINEVNGEFDFDLRSTILASGIQPSEKVLINWFRFDQIDEMRIDDLSTYFDDIWYPAADSIDIFDRGISWILSVGYSGEVTLLKLR